MHLNHCQTKKLPLLMRHVHHKSHFSSFQPCHREVLLKPTQQSHQADGSGMERWETNTYHPPEHTHIDSIITCVQQGSPSRLGEPRSTPWSHEQEPERKRMSTAQCQDHLPFSLSSSDERAWHFSPLVLHSSFL